MMKNAYETLCYQGLSDQMCLANNDVGIGWKLRANRLDLDHAQASTRAYRMTLTFPHCAVLTGQALPGCILYQRPTMKFQQFSFGQIRIDGIEYGYDIVIDRGEIRERKKKPSKRFRDSFGHTPLSLEEEIPWKCRRLVVGTGSGALPVMDEVRGEAERRKVELIILPTAEAMELLNRRAENTNAILHVTC